MKAEVAAVAVLLALIIGAGFGYSGIAGNAVTRTTTSTVTTIQTSSLTLTRTLTLTQTTTATTTMTSSVVSTITSTVGPVTQTTTTTLFEAPSIDAITAANIPVPGASGMGIAVDASANAIYVAGGSTNVIDGASNKVIGAVKVPGGSFYVAANPATHRVYVNNASCAPCTNSILVIDGNTRALLGGINLGVFVDGIDVNPNTNTVYASSANSNSLFIINGTTDQVISNVSLPASPMGVAVNPKTNMVYVPTCVGFVCSPSDLYVINGTSHAIVTEFSAGLAFAIAVNPSNGMVYMTSPQADLLSINATSHVVVDTRLSAYTMQCRGLAVNPGMNQVYVSCGASARPVPNFFIVDGNNDSVLNSFVDQGSPWGLAYDSANQMLYSAHENGYVLALNPFSIALP